MNPVTHAAGPTELEAVLFDAPPEEEGASFDTALPVVKPKAPDKPIEHEIHASVKDAGAPIGTNGGHILSASEAEASVREGLRAAPIRPAPGRRLPYSIEAEESLLSTILLDEDVLPRCVEARIRPDSFYDSKHGILYERLLAMMAANKPISIDILAEELKTSRQLDAIGGYAFLVQVSNRIPTTAEASYFIEKVREQSLLREIIRTATGAIEDCYNFSGGIDELSADIRRRLDFAIHGPANRDSWPDPVAVAALCANPPPIPGTVIDGMLYAPGTMLISGPSKSRKTFTALDLAIAIATGSKWLGHPCTKSVVLYLNLELQDFSATDRLARICSARGIPPPDNLLMWNLRGQTVDLTSLRLKLPEMIVKTGAKVVIVDPHYKISSVSGMEESSNDDQGLLLSAMEGLCHQNGAALILTHHFAKGDPAAKNAMDRASGAGTFTRWPDVFITFTPHQEEEAMTIDFILRNFAPIPSSVARWEYPRWQTDPSLDPANLKRAPNPGSFKLKHSSTDVLECLGDNLWSSAKWEKASGIPHGTFVRKRDELVDAKKVVKFGSCFKKQSS